MRKVELLGEYTPPGVEVLDLNVELGFALTSTGGDGSMDFTDGGDV